MACEYGISNKQYAAVAAGSLAIAALLCGGIRAGYAAVGAAELRETEAALAAAQAAADEADAMAVAPATWTDMSGAEAAVAELLSGYEDKVFVSVRMLDGSGRFDFSGDESVQSASMIKLLVLAEYLDEVDSGELSPTDTYTLTREDAVGGSGSMQEDRVGTVYTLDEVARRMIYQSDNTATNVLIDLMGLGAIADKADELGLSGTVLRHKLMLPANDGTNNMMSANDAASILVRIANGELASAESCERAEVFLLEQEDDEGLTWGLLGGAAFGHKTGTVDGIRHDGGIVYAEHPFVICVFTRGLDYDEANMLMAQIGFAVYGELA